MICVQDTTFEMERRRNRPEKYNREVVKKTLNAIKKISKIRVRRQERFYEQRMRNAKKVAKVVAKQELEKQVCSHAGTQHLCLNTARNLVCLHLMLRPKLHVRSIQSRLRHRACVGVNVPPVLGQWALNAWLWRMCRCI